MKQRNKPKPAAVFGVDIGKNIFHVVGVDTAGQPVQKVRSSATRSCSSSNVPNLR